MKDNYAVIMAGGIGSRFWPMSTKKFPKQFHDILGTGRTLLQMTYDRFLNSCDKGNIFIATNKEYRELVAEQLPELEPHQIMCEPCMRNTAPCIAYATHKINALNPDACIVVAPSDHLVTKEEEFTKTIQTAIAEAMGGDVLVTLGIKPSRPDTGYGYIQFSADGSKEIGSVQKVDSFTEKPNLEKAKELLAAGNFYWNSGIFIWSAKSISNSFSRYLPEINQLFSKGAGFYNDSSEQAFIDDNYQKAENISIDYGVMEKADNVKVVLSEFGWSDLGTWGSLYTHVEHDSNQNALIGNKVRFYESSGNMVKVPDGKTVVLEGLSDYIVVESDGTLLVCRKQSEQLIKQFVGDLASLED